MTATVESGSVVLPLKKVEHLGGHRQYWRDIILGVNDGLISTFLLVLGVSGGGLSTTSTALTGISGALAGAVSMFAGEFVATKSQNQVMTGEISLEQRHIEQYKDEEVAELARLLPKIGITEDESTISDTVKNFYETRPDALLKLMTVLEFGFVDEERRSPLKAGTVSGSLFILGGLPSVIPYLVLNTSKTATILAGALTVLGLILVGAIKTWATRGPFFSSTIENLSIAGVGGALAYGVGVLFAHLVK